MTMDLAIKDLKKTVKGKQNEIERMKEKLELTYQSIDSLTYYIEKEERAIEEFNKVIEMLEAQSPGSDLDEFEQLAKEIE